MINQWRGHHVFHGLRLKGLKDGEYTKRKIVFFQSVVLTLSPDVSHQGSGLPDFDLCGIPPFGVPFHILLIN
jgi:hypothetical protein